MIELDKADGFTKELANLMEKYKLGVFINDCQELEIMTLVPDFIQAYIDGILDNTPRK